MNCVNCGAALPPKSGLCSYCKTLNDIDLRGVFDSARPEPRAPRSCPRCSATLEGLNLGAAAPLHIDRCPSCLGIFFDPGELHAVVDSVVRQPDRIDHKRLQALIDQETPDANEPVKYLRCPTCRELMNRRAYGARSGVVTDECAMHGVWLDAGELRRILRWTAAGGAQYPAAENDLRPTFEPHAPEWVESFDDPFMGLVGRVSPSLDLLESLADLFSYLMRRR